MRWVKCESAVQSEDAECLMRCAARLAVFLALSRVAATAKFGPM